METSEWYRADGDDYRRAEKKESPVPTELGVNRLEATEPFRLRTETLPKHLWTSSPAPGASRWLSSGESLFEPRGFSQHRQFGLVGVLRPL